MGKNAKAFTYLLTTLILFFGAIAANAGNLTIPNGYSSGDTLTATSLNDNFTAVEAEVDDNDTRITANTNDISTNTAAIANTGLLGATVITPPSCQSLANGTTSYQKITDMGTFSKMSDTSTVEIQFNGRLSAESMTSTGVIFELRVDNVATTNGRARSIVKSAEAGSTGVQSTITGLFTNLMAGNRTVSLWARASFGTASNIFTDSGCWSSDSIVVKEME